MFIYLLRYVECITFVALSNNRRLDDEVIVAVVDEPFELRAPSNESCVLK